MDVYAPARPIRGLTWATFLPGALATVALGYGLALDRAIALFAGVYGLYYVFPAAVAWCIDRFGTRLPRGVRWVLAAAMLGWLLLATWLLLTLTPPAFAVAAVPPIAVLGIVAVRLARRSPR